MKLEDIPGIPDRAQRFEAISIECYDAYKVVSACEVYLSDASRAQLTRAAEAHRGFR